MAGLLTGLPVVWAEQRVGLDPAVRVVQRIIAVVEGADVGKGRVVQYLAQIGGVGERIDVAGGHLDRVGRLARTEVLSLDAASTILHP